MRHPKAAWHAIYGAVSRGVEQGHDPATIADNVMDVVAGIARTDDPAVIAYVEAQRGDR